MIKCICSYFNFNKDVKRKINYIKFRKLFNYPITTIEVSLSKEDFFIEDSIKILAKNQNILWQKERCYNIALENFGGNVDKIVWVDTDVVFYQENWLEELEKKLEKYHYVQPFEVAIDGKNQLVSFGKDKNKNSAQGFCWGVRREIIPNGLFDKHPLGFNQILQNISITNDFNNDFIKELDKNTLKSFIEYCEEMPKINFKIGYCSGLIEHFEHKKLNTKNIQDLLKNKNLEISLDRDNKLHVLKNREVRTQLLRKDKSIYLKPINGLGNRLRAINSFLNFAKKYNKNLKIYWSSSSGFDETRFEELFETYNLDDSIEFIKEEEYKEACGKYFCLHENVTQSEITLEYHINDPLKTYKKLEKESFCYEGHSCLSYIFSDTLKIEENFEFLENLKATKEIKNKILEVKKYFNDETIGIHIRRGDATNSIWKTFFLNSSDEVFFEEIKKILIEKPSSKFFLSTDCEETNEKFVKMFKEKIIIQKKSFNDKKLKKEQKKKLQKEATIDMLLLSQTKFILGNNWSSFSDISSKIGRKKIKYVKKINLPPSTFYDDEKISVVTAVKDREQMLKISLNSWVNFKEINEIIIVDWDSKNKIDYFENIDSRIKVLRFNDQKYFNISKAYNSGIKKASHSRIMKLDVDYILNPYFNLFKNIKLNKRIFYTGNWELEELDNNLGFIKYLNGFLFVHKNNFEAVGGYNENLENYGWEDNELYNKLYGGGLKRVTIPFDETYIYHNPHSGECSHL